MTITSFKDENRWLSNFWPSEVELEGETYPTVEHAYQAAKSDKAVIRKLIREVLTPGEAKRVGKKVSIRPDWEQVKLNTMRNLLEQKFQIPELKEKLLDTGTQTLIEGNTWHDNFWGSCSCPKCGNTGHNNLGNLLMELRQHARVERNEQKSLAAPVKWALNRDSE